MKILYLGDIFGKPGRDAACVAIQDFRAKQKIDFVIVNGENATHGKGIQKHHAEELWLAGVDLITLGNHAFDQEDVFRLLETGAPLLRPANYPSPAFAPCPGARYRVLASKKNPELKLAVFQVLGRVFMDPVDCPFAAADQLIEEISISHPGMPIFVDAHAEASSEKYALGHYLDSRVNAVVGSHSHVQTADEQILPGGTAYITDVGMTGCFDSVIGMRKELSIRRFLTKRPVRGAPAEGPGGYGAVLLDLPNDRCGTSYSIERFRKKNARE